MSPGNTNEKRSWRVALVGPEGAGKTLIAQIWANKAKDLNVQPTQTRQTYEVQIEQPDVTLILTDISGRDLEDENVLRDFVTDAEAIVLVFEVWKERSLAKVDSWVPTILSAKSDQAVCFIIANKVVCCNRFLLTVDTPNSPLSNFIAKISGEARMVFIYQRRTLAEIDASVSRSHLVRELVQKFPLSE